MHSIARNYLFIAALALLGAMLAVYSAVRLFGELSAQAPSKAMQQWAIDGQMGSYRERQKLLSRLLMSIRAATLNADHRMDLARFYMWHLRQSAKQSSQHQIYAQRIQRRLLEAIKRRPNWGFAWASLAENSVVSGQYDALINPFIIRALKYGPNEPGTVKKVAVVAMLHWDHLPEPLRRTIRSAITRFLRTDDHPGNLIRLAFSLQWQAHLQPLLQTPAQEAEFTRQLRRITQ